MNTNFGAIAHSEPSAVFEYRVAEAIQSEARASDASVIVFPENVVPYWTASTDAFWSPTLAELRTSGKTVLIGTKFLASRGRAAKPTYDFSAEITTLQTGNTPRVVTGEEPAPTNNC